MKEWYRTVILLLLLAVAIGFIVYLRTGYENHALQVLKR